MISLIETFQQNKNSVYVRAVLEDMVQVYPSSFIFDEDEILPENEEELIDYLDGLDLDWKIVDTSDCSFGFVD